jgi:hypothetical protein
MKIIGKVTMEMSMIYIGATMQTSCLRMTIPTIELVVTTIGPTLLSNFLSSTLVVIPKTSNTFTPYASSSELIVKIPSKDSRLAESTTCILMTSLSSLSSTTG